MEYFNFDTIPRVFNVRRNYIMCLGCTFYAYLILIEPIYFFTICSKAIYSSYVYLILINVWYWIWVLICQQNFIGSTLTFYIASGGWSGQWSRRLNFAASFLQLISYLTYVKILLQRIDQIIKILANYYVHLKIYLILFIIQMENM